MDWEYALADVTALATDTIDCVYLLPPSEINVEYTDPTLMATRWFVTMSHGARVAGGLSSAVGVGIIAWDAPPDVDDALCPGPISNGDLDWITRFVDPVVSGDVGSIVRLVLDSTHLSNARRRLGNQTGILIAFENVNTSSFACTADVRMLIKE